MSGCSLRETQNHLGESPGWASDFAVTFCLVLLTQETVTKIYRREWLEGGSPHIFLSKSAQNCTEKCEGGWAFGALQCEGGRVRGATALRGLLQHQAFTSQ